MNHEFHYVWDMELKASPEALWPFLANTNRFNYDAGGTTMEVMDPVADPASYTYHLANSFFGQKLEWDEPIYSWVYPDHFEAGRYYRNGPLKNMRVQCDLIRRADGGTHLHYQVWAVPRNWLGRLGFPIQMNRVLIPKFKKIFLRYDEIAAQGGSTYDLTGKVEFPDGGEKRLESARPTGNPEKSTVYEHLHKLIKHSDDLAVQRLRPYELADQWGTARRTTLEYFLQLSKDGILDIYWELLCPNCRGAQASHRSLAQIHNQTHCDFCRIDFTVNFDRQVEIVFRPNPAVRLVPEPTRYCLTGPQTRPNAAMLEILQPGETRTFQAHLDTQISNYVLSVAGACNQLPLEISNEENNQLTLIAGTPMGEVELSLGASPTLTLQNPTDQAAHFTIQHQAWRDDTATAADVSTLQIFRDLFPREALSAGREIYVGSVTLMFTDLRDSTRMYREIGDGAAFGRVRQHFDALEQAIANEGGAVVKTIGDAIMAVFSQPLSAVRAIQTAQQEIHALGHDPLLSIKAGIHRGPCIIVTLNERLDYFGTTVNTTARLPGLSHHGEIILTDDIINDPEVAAWIEQNQIPSENFHSHLKGFDQPMSLWKTKLI